MSKLTTTELVWERGSDLKLLSYNVDHNVHAVIAVDLTQGQAPLPQVQPPVPGNHDLAATLKALAANSTSFGGTSAAQGAGIDPDGIDPEMIARSGHCWNNQTWLPVSVHQTLLPVSEQQGHCCM